jgi:Cu(I)/Ag(I) efflux system membrane fusion protein
MKSITLSCLLLGVLGVGFAAGAWYTGQGRRAATAPPAAVDDAGVHDMHAMHGGSGDAAGDLEEGPSSALPPGAVTVSPRKQQLIGVRVSPVETKSATGRLRLYGRVAADETRLYTLNVGLDGFVREISNVTTGSRVRKDDWLATFSAPEARLPIQGYLVALDVLDRARKADDSTAALEQASAGVQQSIERLRTLGMSAVQIDDVARTRRVPPNIRVTAPADGIVLSRKLTVGQTFERGDELYRIADLRSVWILADVSGRDVEQLRPGTAAVVSLADRTRTFRGTISDVPPRYDAVSQQVEVRLDVENPQYVLQPDMFVDVELPVAFRPAMVVPVDAVRDAGLRKTVFVARGGGVFEPREVQTGWRSGGLVEIVTGLSAGESVVVSGAFLLDSETRLHRAAPPVGPRP